jgi:transcriptional regulator with GAF, ATPase, and Fis domain
LGIIESMLGEHERALTFLQTALDRECAASDQSEIVSEILRHKAEAYLRLGKTESALAEAQECLILSMQNEDHIEIGAAHRVSAICSLKLRDSQVADSHFRQAVTAFRKLEEPFELARTLGEYGAELTQGGHDWTHLGRAADYLRESKEIFSELGLRHWVARVDEGLEQTVAAATERAARPGHATERQEVSEPRRFESAQARRPHVSPMIVTRSRVLKDGIDRVKRVAPSTLPILVLGERGTGKELIAGAVHTASGRPANQLVTVNCAAIPRELQDSELFGHRKGSFTGAMSDKAGLFEQADGGTIFLDEIGDLAIEAQAKLLRVLESGEIRRIGEHRCRRVDARVVAATNRDLLKAVDKGEFRADLYDRLDGFQLEIPPLRARPEDIELLVNHFLEEFCCLYDKRVAIADELIRTYQGYQWPGNVRQLRQEIHRLVLLIRNGGTAGLDDSQVASQAQLDSVSGSARALNGSLFRKIDETERRLIVEALTKARGNKAQAARLLNMSRTTLLGKMKRLEIE